MALFKLDEEGPTKIWDNDELNTVYCMLQIGESLIIAGHKKVLSFWKI